MRARPIPLLLLLLAVLGASYTAWWFYAAGVIRDSMANWIAAERAQASFIEYKGWTYPDFPCRSPRRRRIFQSAVPMG